jgi:hypothetical protein
MKKSKQTANMKDFVNPIDKDKITENPSTLPYAHTVGSPVIKPTKQGVIKGRALSAMEDQTDMQLDQIKKQIDLLASQAKEIYERKQLAAIIYSAQMGFKPEINHVYHLYQKEDDNFVLSMIGPQEWIKPKFKEFVYSVRLLADHTWRIEARPETEQEEES